MRFSMWARNLSACLAAAIVLIAASRSEAQWRVVPEVRVSGGDGVRSRDRPERQPRGRSRGARSPSSRRDSPREPGSEKTRSSISEPSRRSSSSSTTNRVFSTRRRSGAISIRTSAARFAAASRRRSTTSTTRSATASASSVTAGSWGFRSCVRCGTSSSGARPTDGTIRTSRTPTRAINRRPTPKPRGAARARFASRPRDA